MPRAAGPTRSVQRLSVLGGAVVRRAPPALVRRTTDACEVVCRLRGPVANPVPSRGSRPSASRLRERPLLGQGWSVTTSIRRAATAIVTGCVNFLENLFSSCCAGRIARGPSTFLVRPGRRAAQARRTCAGRSQCRPLQVGPTSARAACGAAPSGVVRGCCHVSKTGHDADRDEVSRFFSEVFSVLLQALPVLVLAGHAKSHQSC